MPLELLNNQVMEQTAVHAWLDEMLQVLRRTFNFFLPGCDAILITMVIQVLLSPNINLPWQIIGVETAKASLTQCLCQNHSSYHTYRVGTWQATGVYCYAIIFGGVTYISLLARSSHFIRKIRIAARKKIYLDKINSCTGHIHRSGSTGLRVKPKLSKVTL